MTVNDLYDILKTDFMEKAVSHGLMNEPIQVTCKALSVEEAIGKPDQDDYPIIKGKEVMIEATFFQARGQAFTDEFENRAYLIKDLLSMDLSTNQKRASFIAGLNAVYRHLGLTDRTVHCRDNEPVLCSKKLPDHLPIHSNILLIGHQPRFLEVLAAYGRVRAIDLDPGNIGKNFFNICIEPEENTQDAIEWCDIIFATGSTIVNNTASTFINSGKPSVFYGVSISAPAKILKLKTFCEYGH
jgi:hypothetical protein